VVDVPRAEVVAGPAGPETLRGEAHGRIGAGVLVREGMSGDERASERDHERGSTCGTANQDARQW
jgi:hypothetical protein